MLVPFPAILVLPARALLGMPVPPMPGGLVIVAHGDAQEGSGDIRGGQGDPGAVVAGADIPSTIGKGVTLPVVLKDVARGSRRIVDGQLRNDRPFRWAREIDPDVHVHLRLGRP